MEGRVVAKAASLPVGSRGGVLKWSFPLGRALSKLGGVVRQGFRGGVLRKGSGDETVVGGAVSDWWGCHDMRGGEEDNMHGLRQDG
eukprot:9650-Hanusia_phi.AAC.1